jgi:hypothetical protein
MFLHFPCKSQQKESRRADSNRLPLLITSDPSRVAGVCTSLQIPQIYGILLSLPCPVLHRIAFPVVPEWCQTSQIQTPEHTPVPRIRLTYAGLKRGDRRGSNPRPSEPQSLKGCCKGSHRLANPAYVGCFLSSALFRVAPYCVPGGVRSRWMVPIPSPCNRG